MDSSDLTPTHLVVLIIAAILFGTIMIFNAFSLVRHQAWFFWTLVTAAALQFAGYIGLAYQSEHPTDHRAYMFSLSTTTLAPVVLGVTAIGVYSRLQWWITSRDGRPLRILWVPSKYIAPCLYLLQAIVAFFLVFGLVDMSALHSSKPILSHHDAVERLGRYERGLVMLSVGNAVQIVSAGLFSVFTLAFLSSNSIWHSPVVTDLASGLRNLLWSSNFVMVLSFIRSVFKATEFANQSENSTLLVESDIAYFLCDVLPMLVSLLIFCWMFPGAYLPREATQLIVRSKRRAGLHDIPEKPPAYVGTGPEHLAGTA